MAGGPWAWFISPEMAMFVGLARDWLAFVIAIILSEEEDRVSYRKRDNKYRKWVTDQIKIGATKALTYLEKLMIQSLGTSRSRRRRQSSCRSCSACIYGKMTRRAKRTKSKTNPITSRTVTAPGQCVSVDQLESSTPGLIAQLKGTPTISISVASPSSICKNN